MFCMQFMFCMLVKKLTNVQLAFQKCACVYMNCFGGKNHCLAAASLLAAIIMTLQLLCSSDCPVWTNGGPGEQCAAQLKLKSVLRDTFGHERFRPGQLEAVLAVAHGKDVLVRMPTGGGKSMCMFLVPLSISSEAMGIVISPLVGLMEQQVKNNKLLLTLMGCVIK